MVTKKILKTIFKLRRGTEQEWTEVNPVLDIGEPGYAYDIQRLKVGNGVDHWNDLRYLNESDEYILDLVKQLSISDFSDGDDYATKQYVHDYVEDIIIDCGSSIIEV